MIKLLQKGKKPIYIFTRNKKNTLGNNSFVIL